MPSKPSISDKAPTTTSTKDAMALTVVVSDARSNRPLLPARTVAGGKIALLAEAIGVNAGRLEEMMADRRDEAGPQDRDPPEHLGLAAADPADGSETANAVPDPSGARLRRRPGLLAGRIFPGPEILDPTDDDEIRAWHGE